MEDGRGWLYFKEGWRAEPQWQEVVDVKKRRDEEISSKDNSRQPEKWMQQDKEVKWIFTSYEI